MSALAELHFLRPLWLLALLPALFLLWILWHRRGDVAWRKVIAPHLLPHLLSGNGAPESRFRPLHLLAAFWLLAVIAAAGPTWEREPAPFAEQRAPLVIALYVGESMLAEDIQPTRLERATHKIRDLLALRPGARAALIAYAGDGPFTAWITKVLQVAISLAAVMVLMPRMVALLMEGLIPLSEAAREFLQKKAGNREIYIGLDSAIAIGHPTSIATAALMIVLPLPDTVMQSGQFQLTASK